MQRRGQTGHKKCMFAVALGSCFIFVVYCDLFGSVVNSCYLFHIVSRLEVQRIFDKYLHFV